MYFALALLCVSAVAAPGCSGLPTKEKSIRDTVRTVTTIAQITLVHIKKLRAKLPVTTPVEVATPSIEGLTGISRDLGLLNNDLQNPFTDLLSQIHADVSSLEGRVRAHAVTMGCPVPAGSTGEPASNVFPHSRHNLMLTKVQRYLEKFLLNKDKLKVC